MDKNTFNKFLEKRSQLMNQTFLEQEYSKRHFLINTNFGKYNESILALEKNIIYAGDQFLFENLEYYNAIIIAVKNHDYLPVIDKINNNLASTEEKDEVLARLSRIIKGTQLAFQKCYNRVQTFVTEEIILADIYSRTHYNLPFYSLVIPTDMTKIIQSLHRGSTYKLTPIEKTSIKKDKLLDNLFYQAVFSYCDTEVNEFKLLKDENQMLKNMIDKISEGTAENSDLSLAATIYTCSNGKQLADHDLNVLITEIDSRLRNDFRSRNKTALEMRLFGLLFYDFSIAAKSADYNNNINVFFEFFNSYLYKKFKKYEVETTKRTFRDALKLASICIHSNDIVKNSSKVKSVDIPKTSLPDHAPHFHEYKNFIESNVKK